MTIGCVSPAIVKPEVLFGEYSGKRTEELEDLYAKGQAPDWYVAVRENLPIYFYLSSSYLQQVVPEKWLVVDISSGQQRIEIVPP